jgi:hypothetical protein
MTMILDLFTHTVMTLLLLFTTTVNYGFINYFQKCAARWLATAISKNKKSSAF